MKHLGDVIRYNRPRIDSVTKEFGQQLMLGLEYLSCRRQRKEKTLSLRYHNAEKRVIPAFV
jgi:hypothetical protein